MKALHNIPEIEWTLSGKIEAFLLLYDLCPSQRQKICRLLLDLLKETKLLRKTIPIRNLKELESLLDLAQKSLGNAFICLHAFLSRAIDGTPIVLEAKQMIDQVLGKDQPFYFPKQLQESLYDFRERFQISFEEQFLKISLSTIRPEEVRQFQKKFYNDFLESVLQTIFAFPLQVLSQKGIQAELHVYGSIAREELVPYSDLETIFLLEENDQLEQNGKFLKSIIEWINIQASALGESEPTLPKELDPLIDRNFPKGLSLDSTPNLAIAPLRTMNENLPVCMTTLSTLCKFQRGKQLIEELRRELAATVRISDKERKDSRERRLRQMFENMCHAGPQKELSILLEKLNPPEILEDFEKFLKELKKRAGQKSASTALTALREPLEIFEKQNQQDLKLSIEKRKHSAEGRLIDLIDRTTDPEAQEELCLLLEKLNPPQITEQFEEHLRMLKERAGKKSASVTLAALKKPLEEFEEQNEKDLNRALEEHRIREQEYQRLSKQIDTDATQKHLFSLLKTKRIIASPGADFHYEEERSKMLDEIVEVSPSGKTIKRREKKALAKIDQLDRAQEPEKILQTTLDLKNDFIVPIFYPFAPLAVYHSIEAANTLDIIDELAKQKRITESSETLLKQTVAALYVMRVRFHFRFKRSPWKGSHDQVSRLAHLPNSLSVDEQKALDRAYWMVQRPLHDYLDMP